MTLRLLPLVLFFLHSCDCGSGKHQPGFHEQSAKVSWLKHQDSVMSRFLPEATRNQIPADILARAREMTKESPPPPGFEVAIANHKLEPFSNEDLIIQAAGLDLPENQVTYHYTQYREAKNEILNLRAQGLGPHHPKIITLREKGESHFQNAQLEANKLRSRLAFKQSARSSQIKNICEVLSSSTKDQDILHQLQTEAREIRSRYQAELAVLGQMQEEAAP